MKDLSDSIDCLPPKHGSSKCTVSFTTPSDDDGATYVLIAFWTLGAASEEAPGGFKGSNAAFPASAGLYYTDHFAAAGANATSRFFENNVFTNLVTDCYLALRSPRMLGKTALNLAKSG